MRKLKVAAFMTLDGVVEDPGGFGERQDGGWSLPFFDDEARRSAIDELATCDTFLTGRVTYEILSKAWSANTGEYAERLNAMSKLVVSTTLAGPLDWNARVLEGEAADAIAALKRQQGKDIVVYGSATLVRTLLRHDLVDEFRISVFPLVLGGGKRLFPEGTEQARLTLVSAKALASGVTALTYRNR
ncbi:dihydrofolate reductase family protein [Amycolatopsis sp. CA-230715]|uniref:dihydrofolate reductase family protein n=1 Tax=Amycolatopsis sp. CA-230715 TaxID=2745196 RepID=UPI001C0340FD|nr:dihydrofolate reductase family protein [Amycolatopsis sp. CA-230715]QWF83142.1 putative protein YyaP [Amycolatopsis sp. CA-230715]